MNKHKTVKEALVTVCLNRWFGSFLMLLSAGYTYWYLGFSNPLESYGALSIIGLSHPILFLLWGVFTETALYINIEIAYRRAGYQNRWARWLLNLAVSSILITVFVPFDFQQIVQYVIHCYGAISFILYNGVAMLILFVKFQRLRGYLAMACASGVILISTLVLFLTVGESGVLEATPMILSFLILSIVNNAKPFQIRHNRKERTEAQQEEKELIYR